MLLNSCAPKNVRIYFNTIKAVVYPSDGTVEPVDGQEGRNWSVEGPAGVTLKHVNNLNNLANVVIPTLATCLTERFNTTGHS
ncbi:hypothetical protein NQ315_011508 [Exocentrus adspersus]|uniref:Uncharacterized protein n=1 Tax=Exocentrus adspersus TaxID=1586481 RepID=A0AAV8VVW4_9CUCU|nr:hypothetical protein NQ315_011508 [Exocentrus adspersus]